MLDGRIVEEVIFDGEIYPVVENPDILFVAVLVEEAVGFGVLFEVAHDLPHFVDGGVFDGGAGGDGHYPAILVQREEVQGRLVAGAGHFGGVDVVAVGLVDDEGVGHLHDAAFDALQFVAGTGEHQQQEEIDHRLDDGFGLSHADGFDDDDVEAGGLAQHDGFAGLAGHAAERKAGGGGAGPLSPASPPVSAGGLFVEDPGGER